MSSLDEKDTRLAEGMERIETAAWRRPGVIPSDMRRAVFEGTSQEEPLETYIRKVHDAAYKVIDEEVTALMDAGYTEDGIFELTIAAAVGAGFKRYACAMKLLEGGE